jgi:hypothetical protein
MRQKPLITLSSSLRKDARVGSVRWVYIVVVAMFSWPSGHES